MTLRKLVAYGTLISALIPFGLAVAIIYGVIVSRRNLHRITQAKRACPVRMLMM